MKPNVLGPLSFCKQANALARHLLLQTYSLPSVLGSNASSEPWTAVSPAIATDEEFEEEVTTPVILSARVEGIQLLFDSVSGGKVFDKITAGQGDEQREETREIDVDRGCSSERQCWELVVEARAAYLKWSSACVALKQEREEESRRVGGNESEMYAVQAGEDLRVVEAADVAMDAMERILTFQVGSVEGYTVDVTCIYVAMLYFLHCVSFDCTFLGVDGCLGYRFL